MLNNVINLENKDCHVCVCFFLVKRKKSFHLFVGFHSDLPGIQDNSDIHGTNITHKSHDICDKIGENTLSDMLRK